MRLLVTFASFLAIAVTGLLRPAIADAALSCESIFESSTGDFVGEFGPAVRSIGPAAIAHVARGATTSEGPGVQLTQGFYAKANANGFFSVYDSQGRKGKTNKLIFDSTPTALKQLLPFTRRSSTQMIPLTGETLPRVLMTDVSKDFLLHSVGDLSKIDLWDMLKLQRRYTLDLAKILIGTPTYVRRHTPGYSDATSEIGFVTRRDDHGYFNRSFTISRDHNIASTAFVAPKHHAAAIYAMYEVLSDWSGDSQGNHYVSGFYRKQKIVLVEIDMLDGKARKLGEFDGADLITVENPNRPGDYWVTEDARYTEFTLLLNKDETQLRVLGHSEKMGETKILIEQNWKKP